MVVALPCVAGHINVPIDCIKLQQAIGFAGCNDTIQCSQVYDESRIIIDSRVIHLLGVSDDTARPSLPVGILFVNSKCSISGFSIRGQDGTMAPQGGTCPVKAGGNGGHAIEADNSEVTITDCAISGGDGGIGGYGGTWTDACLSNGGAGGHAIAARATSIIMQSSSATGGVGKQEGHMPGTPIRIHPYVAPSGYGIYALDSSVVETVLVFIDTFVADRSSLVIKEGLILDFSCASALSPPKRPLFISDKVNSVAVLFFDPLGRRLPLLKGIHEIPAKRNTRSHRQWPYGHTVFIVGTHDRTTKAILLEF